MKIVVFGSTGATGAHIVEKALAAGHDVTAFARNPTAVKVTHAKLRVVQGDGASLADVEKAVAGQDVVISALGSKTTKKNTVRSDAVRNIVAAMKKHGVRRAIYLSASGVGDSWDQVQRSTFIFGRIIMPLLLKDVYADGAIAEQTLRESGLEFVIVRPVGLTDKPETRRVQTNTDLTQKLAGGEIPRADVAQFMLDQATANDFLGKSPSIWAGR